MIFGAILAGGIGARMQKTDLPKQFLPLGDRPVIIHTMEKFLSCSRFDAVYAGVHPEWLEYTRKLADRFLPCGAAGMRFVSGGSDRNETIQNVISAIETDFGSSEEHVIVSHDAVRPFLTQRILEDNIDGALQYGAVDTVVPAVDTIVVSENKAVISEIPNRAKLYQGQTPQSFRVSLLRSLYRSLTPEEKAILTDACKICVVRNYPVHLVMGEYTNVKITTPGDYAIAQAMAAADDTL